MQTKQVIKAGLIGVAALGLLLAVFHNGFAFSQAPKGSVHVGKTESQCSTSTSSGRIASDFATFDSRHVLLIMEDNHPLTRRIASLLVQQLTNSPYIDQIDQIEPSQRATGDGKAPDAFLRLGLLSIKEGGIATRSMNATVSAALGDRPWESSHTGRDATTPPKVQFSWESTVDSEVRFSGFQTDKYADAALSIADSFAKGISNELRTLSADYPRQPKLPSELYGPYKAVEDFTFLKDLQARRVCSYSDLLTHNQTFWTFETTTNPVPQLQRLIQQIENSNWTLSNANLTNEAYYYASFRQGDAAELEIFRAHQSSPRLGQPEHSIKFVIQYRMPFSRAEREASLETLFKHENASKLLFPFQNQLTGTQRARFLALLETATGDSPQEYLQLAKTYVNRRQTSAAQEMLLCAKALADTLGDSSSLEKNIEKEWKKVSGRAQTQMEITPEICRKLKFLELTNNSLQSFQAQRNFGSPLVFFSQEQDGVNRIGANQTGVHLYSFNISKIKKGVYPWKMIEAGTGHSSSIASSFNIQDKVPWRHSFACGKQSIELQATPLDETRLRYEVKIKPKQP